MTENYELLYHEIITTNVSKTIHYVILLISNDHQTMKVHETAIPLTRAQSSKGCEQHGRKQR